MKILKLIVLLSLFASFQFALLTPCSSAQFYTSSDYVVKYQLADDKVRVTYNITEKNISDTHRILSRSINYPSSVTNASARANGSTLSVSNSFDGTYSKLTVNFNQLVFDKNATIKWELRFDIPKAVVTSGLLRYFYVSGFTADEQTNSFKVYVDAPNEFGASNFISSKDFSASKTANYTRYTFVSGDDGLNPVTLIFGDRQIFDFSFEYSVNPLASVEFVVPSDRYNQQVFFTAIEPMPATSRIDKDGNYIIKYTPESLGGSNSITFAGSAIVYKPDNNVQKKDAETDFSKYLEPGPYWEADNPNISAKSSEITEGLVTNFDKAEAIYQFVADTLVYSETTNLSLHERKGAAVSLLSPENSVCQEYTDLFIALSRAVGVPAREVAGYAEDVRSERTDSLILHSWVEFWDEENGWTMADPTWGGSSKGYYFANIGSDHFSMLVRGQDSITPAIIASFGKDNGQDSLQLSASTSSPDPEFSGSLKAEQFGNLPVVKFSVTNTGNTVLTISEVYANFGNNNFWAEPDSTLIALPGTTTGGFISVFEWDSFPFKTSPLVNVYAKVTNPYFGNSEITAETELENSWVYVGLGAVIFGILSLALLIVLLVQCKRHVKQQN